MAMDIKKFAHPAYLKMLPDYRMIRDCFDGERAVKDAGVAYLPALKGQIDEDYNNYKNRALFFPITGKTATTMVGLATVKPPKVGYPSNLEKYFVDSNREQQFTESYVRAFLEIILMGRYGVLIDAPKNVEGDPKLCCYIAENIVRWETDEYGLPTDLLLKEHGYKRKPDSQFEMEEFCRYRHCYLDSSGVYTVETLDEDLVLVDLSIQPVFSGSTINFIPFVCFGSSGVHMSPDRPPMLDIATINVSHYRTSADLEWGRHITGLPTPVVSGVDAGTNLKIGGTSAWVLPVVDAKAYYLEFTGQGLQSLEKAMTEKVGLMASVSARLIDNSTRGSEAAETVRLRYMSESAGLIHSIGAVESGLNILYNMLSKLMKESLVTILFSREIVGAGITFKDLKTLFEGYFQGGMSKESLLFNLRRLEAVDPNRTDADELAAIRNPQPVQTQQPSAAN